MAKEIREILAFHRELHVKGGNLEAVDRLASIEASVDVAERSGDLLPSMPQAVRVEQPIGVDRTQLVEEAKKAWKLKDVPTPPEALFATLERAQKEGLSFEPFYFNEATFKKNSKFPGHGKKPEDWFWRNIQDGNIDKDATHLKGGWVLIDPSPKPTYDGGRQMYQMYQKDRLNQTLMIARSHELIKITDWTKHVPNDSRFEVSWDEINQVVVPKVAAMLEVGREQVSLPKEIEFNIAGNIAHPEWGGTNTWEWMADQFRHDFRLVGGGSGYGGLSGVRCSSSGHHYDSIGFRLLVRFPQK